MDDEYDGVAVASLADRLPAATDSLVDTAGLTKAVGMAPERWQEVEVEEEVEEEEKGGGGNSGGGNGLAAELRLLLLVSSIMARGCCLFMGCHSNGTAARLERSSPELLLVLLVLLPTLPRLSFRLLWPPPPPPRALHSFLTEALLVASAPSLADG